ncbi:MAG: hypothetical protein ACK5PQ_05140 [Alphaproteobacteria bacterium]
MRFTPFSYFTLIAACLGLYNGVAAPANNDLSSPTLSRSDATPPPTSPHNPLQQRSLLQLFPLTHGFKPLVQPSKSHVWGSQTETIP